MLNVRFLAGTLVVLAVAAPASWFWRQYQVHRSAGALYERAEALAAGRQDASAVNYLELYLQLRPGDATARVRLAELFDRWSGDGKRAVELYRVALGAAGDEITLEKRLTIRQRMGELLLDEGELAAAENEADKLCQLEQQHSAALRPEQRKGPGLKALVTYAEYRADPSNVSRSDLEDAFRQVLEPRPDEPGTYQDPRVYLARYEYRLTRNLPGAVEDLEAALRVSPSNVEVLLAAAGRAHRELLAARRKPGAAGEAQQQYAAARAAYEQVIRVAPLDERGYHDLGSLDLEQGDARRAADVWRRGLKAASGPRVSLHLSLAELLIRSDHLREAEAVVKSLIESSASLGSRARMPLQPWLDLRQAQIALRRGQHAEAIALAGTVAGSRAGEPLFDGHPGPAYEAWMVQGDASAAQRHWDQALAAYDQAVLSQPQEIAPYLAAAEASQSAGRRGAAIRYCQQALAAIGDAPGPSQREQRQRICRQLISLLKQEHRSDEAERYQSLWLEDQRHVAEADPGNRAPSADEALARAVEGKAEEAIGLYREILRQDPDDITAMNNLATLLAEKPEAEKRREALQCVERAIALAGPLPMLLDTKGMALFHDGQLRQSLSLLEQAASASGADVRFAFHLAVTYERLGEREKALAALEQARQGDLSSQPLTTTEQALLRELEAKLGL